MVLLVVAVADAVGVVVFVLFFFCICFLLVVRVVHWHELTSVGGRATLVAMNGWGSNNNSSNRNNSHSSVQHVKATATMKRSQKK